MLTTALTIGQLALLGVAVLFLLIGGGMSLLRLWQQRRNGAHGVVLWLILGIAAQVGVLFWHSISRGDWWPISDNFDALVWLAVLLSLFVLYIQRGRREGGLDWFVMPIVILLLLAAGYLGRTHPQEYVRNIWLWVHYVSAYGGAVAFAIAASAGAMYLVNSRRLRSKAPLGRGLSSLERLETLTMRSVQLGFALLSIGLVTGFIFYFDGKKTSHVKVGLAVCVWLVYAVVLHSPATPSFRGRKVAILSIAGFVLMVGAILAEQLHAW